MPSFDEPPGRAPEHHVMIERSNTFQVLCWLMDHIEAHDTLRAPVPPRGIPPSPIWQRYMHWLRQCRHDHLADHMRQSLRCAGELIGEYCTAEEMHDFAQRVVCKGNVTQRWSIFAECWAGIRTTDGVWRAHDRADANDEERRARHTVH